MRYFPNKINKLVFFFLSFVLFSFQSNSKRVVADFKLLNIDGNYVSLNNYENAKGFIVVFTCNHCPFAKLYPGRLNKLNEKYQKLGIPLIAISSTDTVSYEEDGYANMQMIAKTLLYNYPYLLDAKQVVAKNFNAQKTPHAFIIWKENNSWVIKYNGAIDDNGAEPEKVTVNFVENALQELLAAKKVSNEETKSIGCQIYFRKSE